MSINRKWKIGAAALALLALISGAVIARAAPDSAPAPATIDSNGDGKADAWDRNTDGKADAWDTNGDGRADAWDDDNDGKPDPAPTPTAAPAPPPER